MDPHTIAKKLRPLIPKKVGNLIEVRELADPETQLLIDHQIIHLGRKHLGDYKDKPLLSLPPESKSNGVLKLGNVIYEKEKWPFGLSKGELLQNLAIFGRSGSGKTNCTFVLLERLVDAGIPFLYLDWKRTARHMLPRLGKKVNIYTPGRSLSPFPFNPFTPPPGIEKHLHANQVIDTLASAYTLGEGAKSLLQKAIGKCYEDTTRWPTIKDVTTAVEELETKERAHGWKISLIRALRSLEFSKLAGETISSQQALADGLCHTNTILELDGLDQSAKKFFVPLVCSWLYHYRLGKRDREQLNLVIVVEEAHHLFYRQERRANEPLMDMLMRQCREVGIGIVVVDQHPHLISSAALGNTYTTICLNQKDPTDINKAAGLCQLNESDKRHLSTLSVGHGIVKMQDRWTQPFLVRFPLMDIQKGSITDDMFKQRHFNGNTSLSGVSAAEESNSSEIRRNPMGYLPLTDECLLFLGDVSAHRNDGVSARYRRLGWGNYKGIRIKNRLVRDGWLDEQLIEVGHTRKLVLRPSGKCKELMGDVTTRESIAHEYWKRWYAEEMRRQGFQVRLEATRHGGKVDVLAFDETRTIGIEIETGKSDVVSNVRNGLRSKFDRLIVVAVGKSALSQIENLLAKQNLLIPARIEVVTAPSLPAPPSRTVA